MQIFIYTPGDGEKEEKGVGRNRLRGIERNRQTHGTGLIRGVGVGWGLQHLSPLPLPFTRLTVYTTALPMAAAALHTHHCINIDIDNRHR
jgi:hypothetical protein